MNIYEMIREERKRQDEKWGQQNHPDGTGQYSFVDLAQRVDWNGTVDDAKRMVDSAFKRGQGTWTHILAEEFIEAISETDIANLKIELVQLSAVAVAWIESLERRDNAKTP